MIGRRQPIVDGDSEVIACRHPPLSRTSKIEDFAEDSGRCSARLARRQKRPRARCQQGPGAHLLPEIVQSILYGWSALEPIEARGKLSRL